MQLCFVWSLEYDRRFSIIYADLFPRKTTISSIAAVLNEEIRRLARKEIRDQVGKSIKHIAGQLREITALKRQGTELANKIAFLERQEKNRR